MNDGFLVDDMYKARAETFFEIRDDNNCERKTLMQYCLCLKVWRASNQQNKENNVYV